MPRTPRQDRADEARRGKIAVRVNFAAAEGEADAVRTAGYVQAPDLRDPRHTLIEGALDD